MFFSAISSFDFFSSRVESFVNLYSNSFNLFDFKCATYTFISKSFFKDIVAFIGSLAKVKFSFFETFLISFIGNLLAKATVVVL